MAFDLLGWLAEPKSDRVRQGTAFGCFGAAAFGIPLLFLLLAFGAIPHCKTCASETGGHLAAGVALSTLFGLVTGALTAAALRSFQEVLGRPGAVLVLTICIAAAAYLGLEPALKFITA
ncbi:MAG TPA: hypothetical protein VFR52_04700 [Sphingomicrobium sp.]|nr:hypothetical protein [Sphingomicrobium sp.]